MESTLRGREIGQCKLWGYAIEITFAWIAIMNDAGGMEISVRIVQNGHVIIVRLMIVSTASLSKTILKNTGNPGKTGIKKFRKIKKGDILGYQNGSRDINSVF